MKPYLSPSTLDHFKSCPARYFFEEESMAGKRKSRIMDQGKAAHASMEQAFKGTVDDYAAAVLSKLEGKWFPLANVDYKTEVNLALPMPEYSLELIGVADFLQVSLSDKRAYIADWKTGLRMWSNQDAEDSLQGKVYAYILFMLHPELDTVFFDIVMTHYGVVRSVQFKRDLIHEYRADILYHVDEIRRCYAANDWPTRPGSKCSHCPCLKKCSSNVFMKDNAEIDIITTDAEWKKLYQQGQATTAYLEKVMEVLKAYAIASGKDNIAGIKVETKVVGGLKLSTKKETRAYLDEHFKDKIVTKADYSGIIESLTEEQKAELIRLGHLSDGTYQTVKIGG